MSQFKWDDPLLLDAALTDDERMVRDAAHEYCRGKLLPRVLEANRHERFDREIITKWARWASSARPCPRSTAAPDSTR